MHLKSRLNRATAMIFLSKHLGQQAGRIYHAVSPSFAIEIFKNPVLLSEQVSLSFTITLCGTQSHLLFSRHSVLTPPIYPLKRFCQQINQCRRFHSVLTPLIYPLKPRCTALLDRRSPFIQFLLHQSAH